MPLTKPYHRIWRPMIGLENPISAMVNRCWDGNNDMDPSYRTYVYIADEPYANGYEMLASIRATKLILRDINDLFFNVEPNDANLSVYSHRLYELLLRISTEFEANCKGILLANNYQSRKSSLTIEDYFKINKATHLAEYTICINLWQGDHIWKPFEEWNEGHSLSWYKAYNEVKHDRYSKFSNANLNNVMQAISALICVLHAQYGCLIKLLCDNISDLPQTNQLVVSNLLFTLQTPTFSFDEQYDFNWEQIKTQPNPVDDFSF